MFDSDNMHDKSNLDWSVFDAVYLINLRERIDRRREMEAELCSVASASKHTRILIMEDDACFPRSGTSRLRDALIRLKSSAWQIWYGGHLFVGNDQPYSHGWGTPIDRTVAIQRAHCIGFQGTATIDSIRKFFRVDTH
jgi:hypothetical protein